MNGVTMLNKWKVMGFVGTFFFAGRIIAFCQPSTVSENVLPAKPGQEAAESYGGSIVLTLDSRIQRLAEESLRGITGAVVVLNPNNGDVLAMASSPSVNSNRLGSVVSKTLWDDLKTNDSGSVFNKATAEVYPAGSVFKPITALAALQSGRITTGMVVDCTGSYQNGNGKLHCLNKEGHGRIDLRKAIEQSCNVYFAAIGEKCGHDAIADMAVQSGLGVKSGIELAREASGLVPTAEWKKRVFGAESEWQLGDTCAFSIGQGALSVTPLQMAVVSAALANGGNVFKPRLVLGSRDQSGNVLTNYPVVCLRHFPLAPEMLETVRQGMRDVIMSPTGTGNRAQVPGVEMAGKTGSALSINNGHYTKEHNAWMILFAPYDNPKYAVALVVKDGISGGTTVAPRLRELMAGIFK
jgi:penicillin-binding protein 2